MKIMKIGDVEYRGFRRLRAASDFARGGKVTKTPPGTAPDEHFVLIVAFPRTPVYGSYPLKWAQPFRRARPGVLGCHSVRPHWGPALEENWDWRGPSSAPEFAEPTFPGPVSAVGATLAVARGPVWDRPLRGERDRPCIRVGAGVLIRP